jgi:alpha-glucosidase (family GH31 glycosyl hydrolase)
MRALFVDHDDPAVWEFPYQYMFGDALLVAPVCWEGVTELSLYLPQGEWVDAWTGQQHAGGRTVTRDVPVDIIPVYVRAERAADLADVFRTP